jgi:outer membrane lipoprotein carrier protein
MRAFLTVFLWLLCSCCLAKGEEVAAELKKRLERIQTLSANFQQEISNEGRLIQTSSGRLFIMKPKRFFLQSKQTNEQEVIADGKKLWVYDIDLDQVTVSNQQKALLNTPAAFLSQNNLDLAKEYIVTKKVASKLNYYKLKPKERTRGYLQVVLGFEGEVLRYISVLDQLSQMSRLRLSQVRINQTVDKALFSFSPPKGVDVIHNN